eukprot:758328-Hanusia_phi.AAC.9
MSSSLSSLHLSVLTKHRLLIVPLTAMLCQAVASKLQEMRGGGGEVLQSESKKRPLADGEEEETLSDAVTRFDEVSCAQGWLGRFQGLQVMGIIQRFRQSLERVRGGGGGGGGSKRIKTDDDI